MARRNIKIYQYNLRTTYPELAWLSARRHSVFNQFHAFAISIVDRFAVWQQRIQYQDLVIHDPDDVYAAMDNAPKCAKGQIFLVSHLGNIEICRALVKQHTNAVLNVLIHDAHAVRFNQALAEAGANRVQLIQVRELDIELMMQLKMRIERGEWLAIAADRVPIRGEKTVKVDFLGHSASWPQGPWILAGLLKVPVCTLFCLKQQGQYNLYLNHFADKVILPRIEREKAVREYVERYAQRLAEQCRHNPLQWFNFYSFWS